MSSPCFHRGQRMASTGLRQLVCHTFNNVWFNKPFEYRVTFLQYVQPITLRISVYSTFYPFPQKNTFESFYISYFKIVN